MRIWNEVHEEIELNIGTTTMNMLPTLSQASTKIHQIYENKHQIRHQAKVGWGGPKQWRHETMGPMCRFCDGGKLGIGVMFRLCFMMVREVYVQNWQKGPWLVELLGMVGN
ncbi:hypothetical protein E2542_SST09301 [Spatholobus suberectus]|nr:hypothetical protein E2542_SST09301 [Spatholobus suberectus]